jgi:hypothetical protein
MPSQYSFVSLPLSVSGALRLLRRLVQSLSWARESGNVHEER